MRRVLEYVGDDFHRERWRIDIGVAHHELLENVVLDGSCHLFELCALLQTCHNVEGEDGKHSSVHGHGHRHLVERYAVEEHLHVFLITDGHSGLTHIAHYTLVVGVVATVGGQVKGHRQTLLA